jgi:hypothetical protein
MEFAVHAGAASARSPPFVGKSAGRPSIAPWTADFADTGPSDTGDFPEIDCIRPLLAADVLAAAEQRAAAVGVGADRVLVASGAVSEEAYLRALAQALGVKFEPLDGIPRALCPINDERLIECAAAGLLPLAIDDELYVVVAPRGTAARQIVSMIKERPARAQRFCFTSAERLNRFVLRYAGKPLAARASDRLKQTWPLLSAAPPRFLGNIVPVAIW